MTQTAHGVEFTQQPSATPKSAEERAAILANPGFGNYFTDHTAVVDYKVDEHGNGGWHSARIEAYGPIMLDPSAAVLHYGQEIFEGLKAYRHADGTVWTFRPEANAARLNQSARRLALPELPAEYFLGAIRELVSMDKDWVPSGDGEALYLRPFMIATEAFLGVRAAREVSFRVIASPVGNYFGGELKPVSIWLSDRYSRAGEGGTGAAKCGGNYAAGLSAQAEAIEHGCDQVIYLDALERRFVDELGGMNVFFVYDDGSLVTPPLGTILPGITRDSVMTLARRAGHTVQERPVSLTEWQEGAVSGRIREAFACGTAAVITPIGRVRGTGLDFTMGNGGPGLLTQRFREQLVAIQRGLAPDPHGWIERLL